MTRSPVLDDAEPPRRQLLFDAMVEQDHAVGHVFLETLARERSVSALCGDHRRDAAVLQPAEQPAQLGAQQRHVGEAGKQRFDRIQNDALRADAVDCKTKAQEKPLQVVLARLFDLPPVDEYVIERELPFAYEHVDVEAERADVLREFLFGFLERDACAWFVELGCAANQELHPEQGLAATRTAADQCRPAARKTAQRNLVQSGYAGARLRQLIASAPEPHVGVLS